MGDDDRPARSAPRAPGAGPTEGLATEPLWALPIGTVCPECVYDLRGSTSPRCPECGFSLHVLRTPESQLPWFHRRKLGRMKAYWQTVWMVAIRPKRLCLELAREVSYPDSQRFRWFTCLHAYATILAASAALLIFDHLHRWKSGPALWWWLGGINVFIAVLLVGVPGIGSYFFQSRLLPVSAQNRAIALSYYLWAPLATLPLMLPFWIVGFALWSDREIWPAAGPSAAVGLGVYAVFLAQRRFVRFTQYLLHRGWWAALTRLVVLNLLAVALGLLVLVVPLCVLYWLAIWRSVTG